VAECTRQEQMFTCDICDDDGKPCGKTFASNKGLLMHQRFSNLANHGYRTWLSKLCPTNMCIMCGTCFSNKKNSLDHMTRSWKQGRCIKENTALPHTFIPPRQLRCAVCSFEADDWPTLKNHLRGHLPTTPRIVQSSAMAATDALGEPSTAAPHAEVPMPAPPELGAAQGDTGADDDAQGDAMLAPSETGAAREDARYAAEGRGTAQEAKLATPKTGAARGEARNASKKQRNAEKRRHGYLPPPRQKNLWKPRRRVVAQGKKCNKRKRSLDGDPGSMVDDRVGSHASVAAEHERLWPATLERWKARRRATHLEDVGSADPLNNGSPTTPVQATAVQNTRGEHRRRSTSPSRGRRL
jgi:hypothetical protein